MGTVNAAYRSRRPTRAPRRAASEADLGRLCLASIAAALLLSGCGSAAHTSPSSNSATKSAGAPSSQRASTPAVPELVGEWQRLQKCSELQDAMTRAGLHDALLHAIAEDDWIPGVTKESEIRDPAHPCVGAVDREHSHVFTADGQFRSLDATGMQVDDGQYRLVGTETLIIGDTTFHYRISGHDTLSLTPVIPHCAPSCFAAGWSVSVAYAGYTWHRIATAP